MLLLFFDKTMFLVAISSSEVRASINAKYTWEDWENKFPVNQLRYSVIGREKSMSHLV